MMFLHEKKEEFWKEKKLEGFVFVLLFSCCCFFLFFCSCFFTVTVALAGVDILINSEEMPPFLGFSTGDVCGASRTAG